MNRLDPESQEFIKWVEGQLSQKNKLDLFSDIIYQLGNYYLSQPLPVLRKKLKEKMIKGALEHGELKASESLIEKEIEMEALDLIGWHYMKKYVERSNN